MRPGYAVKGRSGEVQGEYREAFDGEPTTLIRAPFNVVEYRKVREPPRKFMNLLTSSQDVSQSERDWQSQNKGLRPGPRVEEAGVLTNNGKSYMRQHLREIQVCWK